MSGISWYLQGPYPDDLANIASVVRAALDVVDDVPTQVPEVAPGETPSGAVWRDLFTKHKFQAITQRTQGGLYALWRLDRGALALAGFWVCFGPKYFELGPAGPPDREPPFAREILDVVTEAVWWRWARPAIWPSQKNRWQPMIVLEWPEPLAVRSKLPPPGPDGGAGLVEAPEESIGDWLLGEDGLGPFIGDWILGKDGVEPLDGSSAPGQPRAARGLARDGVLLALIRGSLEVQGNSHRGKYELVQLPPAGAAGGVAGAGEGDGPDGASGAAAGVEEMDAWLSRAFTVPIPKPFVPPTPTSPPPADPHRHTGPLEVPGVGRVGFAITGWLTRNLDPWPATPPIIQPGHLQTRDVGSRWVAMATQALASTVVVLASMLVLVGLIQWISQPSSDAAQPPTQARPQPALSVCSPEHELFMAEFRCQMANMVEARWTDAAVCGDQAPDPLQKRKKGTPELETIQLAGDYNLHPEACGLLDAVAEVESSASPDAGYDLATLAAAKACFNVLGRPYRYAREGEPDRVNPAAFFERADLSIPVLVDTVDGIRAACGVYRTRLEARTQGAILSTHVRGGGEKTAAGGSALQDMAVGVALSGRSQDEAECYRAGMSGNILEARTLEGLCGGTPSQAEIEGRRVGRVGLSSIGAEGWRRLGGASDGEGSAVTRYLHARFGGGKRPTLWSCHDALIQAKGNWDVTGAWDMPIRGPTRYNDPFAGIVSQLQLDATLATLRAEGAAAGPCWSIVAKEMERYTPIHPLIAEVDPAAWPIDDQQVCGQVCAAYYKVRGIGGKSWVTPGSDLAQCVSESGKVPVDDALGRLDPLGIPWNALRSGDWIPERDLFAQVCAFNLVAQGYFGEEKDGILPEGVSPQEWAGSVEKDGPDGTVDVRVTGSAKGIAALAAQDMSGYGRMSSMAACGSIATQCFTPMLLEDLRAGRPVPSYWVGAAKDRWPAPQRRDIYVSTEKGTKYPIPPNPWCEIILPYLPQEGALPEGQLDYPCARGVEDTRLRIEAALQTIRNQEASP